MVLEVRRAARRPPSHRSISPSSDSLIYRFFCVAPLSAGDDDLHRQLGVDAERRLLAVAIPGSGRRCQPHLWRQDPGTPPSDPIDPRGPRCVRFRVLGSGSDCFFFRGPLQSNPENTVGVMTMAGKGVRVLVTPTSDLGKILACMHGEFPSTPYLVL